MFCERTLENETLEKLVDGQAVFFIQPRGLEKLES